jgi:hypothetical protein
MRTYCECSGDKSPVGRCFGSVLIAYPNRKSCMTGRAMIRRNVIGSRRTWIHSLCSTARNRATENRFIGPPGQRYWRHPAQAWVHPSVIPAKSRAPCLKWAPACARVTRGRCFEQQQLWFMQDTGCERQPLLPAARKVPGKLVRPLSQTHPRDHVPPARRRPLI